ncbi:TPA: hypothetical protein VGS91_004851 [Citrobacter freundii]|nr:hypothetical protein [Citrobacter freundii]
MNNIIVAAMLLTMSISAIAVSTQSLSCNRPTYLYNTSVSVLIPSADRESHGFCIRFKYESTDEDISGADLVLAQNELVKSPGTLATTDDINGSTLSTYMYPVDGSAKFCDYTGSYYPNPVRASIHFHSIIFSQPIKIVDAHGSGFVTPMYETVDNEASATISYDKTVELTRGASVSSVLKTTTTGDGSFSMKQTTSPAAGVETTWDQAAGVLQWKVASDAAAGEYTTAYQATLTCN